MTGTVFDIGYRNYTGAREGRRRGRLAVFKDGVRIALGWGRGGRAKILPWFFIGVLTLIGLIMAFVAGAANRFGGEGTAERMNLPSHGDFYGFAGFVTFVFAAVVAPELLCRDKREGTINLYLVRPITGTDYIAARCVAFLVVMTLALWLPQLILFIGLAGGATFPVAYIRANWLDVPKFLLAGLAMSLYATAVAMLAASFTNRRAFASVFLVGLFFISTPFTVGLSEELGGTLGGWIAMFNLAGIPVHVGDVIFGDISEFTKNSAAKIFTDASLVVWWALWVVVPGAILWWRYRRLSV